MCAVPSQPSASRCLSRRRERDEGPTPRSLCRNAHTALFTDAPNWQHPTSHIRGRDSRGAVHTMRRYKLLMHSLDGSQVRCAQERNTVQGYLRGGSTWRTRPKTQPTPGGTQKRGCQGVGWGWPSEQRGRALGPCRLADGALLGGGRSAHTTWCPGGRPAPSA